MGLAVKSATTATGVGVAVGDTAGVIVGVGDCVGVDTGAGVAVETAVGVAAGVGDGVAVGVGVGTMGADSVVKVHEWLASRVVPAKFAACAPVVIVAV